MKKNFLLKLQDARALSKATQNTFPAVGKHFQNSQEDSPAEIHLQGKVTPSFIVFTQIIQHEKKKRLLSKKHVVPKHTAKVMK